MTRYLLALFCLTLSLNVLAVNTDDSFAGIWAGTARYHQETTRLSLHIVEHKGKFSARISLLDIGVSGWPAIKVSAKGRNLQVVLPSDSGPQELNLEWTGQLLAGGWTEKNFTGPAQVRLARIESPVGSAETRILLEGKAGKLGASVIIPEGEGPFPAVVFLQGSGPQPRDASRFAAQSFAQLGIASLIYDKRGVAESEGSFEGASFDDLAEDAVTAATYLKGLSGVSEVGFSGHSQGGWLAPLAASKWQHSAFVITSAGPAVSPAREGEWSFVYAIKEHPDAEQVIPLVREIVAAWHAGLRTGDWDGFDGLSKQYKRKDWFKRSGLRSLSRRPNKAFANSYKLFMDYDPVPTLNKLSVPMLAIFAPDDESIDSAESVVLLNELVSSGRDIQLVSYPGYSHAMRKIASGSQRLRFPHHPEDYFSRQASFIQTAVGE